MKLIMKLVLALLCSAAIVDAFSTVSPSRTSRITRSNAMMMPNNLEPEPSMTDDNRPTQSQLQLIQKFGRKAWERMDTMKAAGLADGDIVPMKSGFKTNIGLLVGAFLFKWYRARFVTKVSITVLDWAIYDSISLKYIFICCTDSSMGSSAPMEYGCNLTRTRERAPCIPMQKMWLHHLYCKTQRVVLQRR